MIQCLDECSLFQDKVKPTIEHDIDTMGCNFHFSNKYNAIVVIA